MDIVDRAAELEEQQRRDAIAASTRANAAQSSSGCAECCDCGETIPKQRREANPCARRCIDCQSATEHRHRNHGGHCG